MKEPKKRAYIAGKLNSDAVGYIGNVRAMCIEAEKVRQKGYSVFVPALDIVLGLILGWETYEDYFNNSQPWLDVSDIMYVCPDSEDSIGTNKEIARAHNIGIPVYFNVENVPDA